MYTYFIISPGYDEDSYVEYPDGTQGNYIKFGDSQSAHTDSHGIRQAYLTHNPDIGVACVMDSTAISQPNLGTRLKNHIVNVNGISPVGNSEWFSVDAQAAWQLFDVMKQFDGWFIDNTNMSDITDELDNYL